MADTTSTCIKSFLSFPTEITLRILAELDVEDVLTVQMVSKRLRTIAKEHSLWTHLFHSCYAQLMPRAPLLEEPFQAYTAGELEKLVTHRSRQRKLWSGEYSGPLVSRIRLEFCSPFRSSLASLLIRGGRWLLTVTSDNAGILVYDLDSPLVKPKVLCVPLPLQESDFAGIRKTHFRNIRDMVDIRFDIEGIIYDIDDDSPTLQLNLCVRGTPGDDVLVFQIWRVALTGHGDDATLSAVHTQTIVTVLSYFAYTIFVETLKKDYLLLTIKDRNSQAWQDRRALTILDWKRSTSTDICTALIQVDITRGPGKYNREHMTSATLLPNNKVLCFTTSSAMLYDMPEFRLVPKGSFTFKGIREVTQPLWTLPDLLNGKDGEDSQTIVVYGIPPSSPGSGEGDTIKALFSTDNGIYGLALQEENILTPPRLFRAIAFPEKSTGTWCLTPGAAFIACGSRPYATGGYARLGDDTVESVDAVARSSYDQWEALPSLPFEQDSIADSEYDTATAVYPVNLKDAAHLQSDDESGRLVMTEHHSGDFMTIHVMEKEWARCETTAKMPSPTDRRRRIRRSFRTS